MRSVRLVATAIATLLATLALIVGLSAALAQGAIRVDGSSTVYPISRAMAEEFSIDHPHAPVAVSFSGSGAGIGKLCNGESDVANASRVIRASELAACAANGIAVYELPATLECPSRSTGPAPIAVPSITSPRP